MEVITEFFASYLTGYAFGGAISLALFILQGFGLYSIARRRGIHHAWLAWVPIGNRWVLGSVSDQYQHLAQNKVTSRRKIMLILGAAGMVVTYAYNYVVSKLLFPKYSREQFLTMYGMLTGTASTGVILLREVDGDFKTPAADNLVYQNFPAIVFGFPLMLLAILAPQKPFITFLILFVFFLVMNVILFRSFIFRRRKK